MESRIRLHKSQSDKIGLDERVDVALAFYMMHEVPNQEATLRELYGLVKPGGEFILIEPKMHVSAEAFRKTVETAASVGFKLVEEWGSLGSRGARFARKDQ